MNILDTINSSLGVILIIGGGLFTWWLRSYLGEKAQHLAKKEDFEQLLNQQKETTREVESIRSEITHGTWLRQRQWELRRETYGNLLAEFYRQQAMDGVRLSEVQVARSGHISKEQFEYFETIRRKQSETFIEHNQLIMTALFIVSPKAQQVLHAYLNQVLMLSREEATQDNILEQIDQTQTLRADTFAKLLIVAQQEFSEEYFEQPTPH